MRLLGIRPWDRRWGNPARTQHNPVLRQRVVFMMTYLRADKLWKGWRYQVGTWNVDSLTGRAGELVETLAEGWIVISIGECVNVFSGIG